MSVTQESFELYTFYVAIKSHFTKDDFDYFKTKGGAKASVNALERRKDKSFFYTVSKRVRDPKSYVFANVLHNPNVWIGDIAKDREQSDKVHVEWERRMQSLSYAFKEDIGKLNLDFNTNFEFNSGHPPLLRLYLKKSISLETMVILDMILSYVRIWDRKINDPVWRDISRQIKKYKPFLSIELAKFKKILQDKFV